MAWSKALEIPHQDVHPSPSHRPQQKSRYRLTFLLELEVKSVLAIPFVPLCCRMVTVWSVILSMHKCYIDTLKSWESPDSLPVVKFSKRIFQIYLNRFWGWLGLFVMTSPNSRLFPIGCIVFHTGKGILESWMIVKSDAMKTCSLTSEFLVRTTWKVFSTNAQFTFISSVVLYFNGHLYGLFFLFKGIY